MRKARDWSLAWLVRNLLRIVVVLQLAVTTGPWLVPAGAADATGHAKSVSAPAPGAISPLVADPKDSKSLVSGSEPANPQVVADGPGHYTLDSGDKIKVRIYQRDDLSGEFLVGTRGSISLPLLGTFQVAGRDEDQVRNDISEAARKVMDRSVDVVVDVTERRPIYIVGFVERPGVYPFALSMTVVHGLSMAGGPYRPAAGNRALELGKQLDQVQHDTDTLKLSIVRLARLEAERDQRQFTEAPRELLDLVGEAEARDLMTREQRQQASEAEVRANLLDTNKHAREYAKQELDDLHLKIAQIDSQIKLNQTQKVALKILVSKGFTRTFQVAAVDSNDATLTISRLDVLANISRATRTLEELNADATAKDLARRRELDAEVNTLSHQTDALKVSLRSGRNMLGLSFGQDPMRASLNAESQLVYSIMRRTSKGFVTLAADDVTPLLPGDVLRVSVPQTSATPITAGSN